MINTLFSDPLIFFLNLIGLVAAITIHEFAHAFAADKLGDPTPRIQDRLTLNPLAHLDPVGTIAILLIGFGWGKPVLFDPYNLKDPKKDTLLIALAGPLSNILLAIALAGIYQFGSQVSPLLGAFGLLMVPTIFINVMLAIFNLVPVHPLDGGKILVGLLPDEWAREAQSILSRYGTMILLFLILPIGPGGNSAVSSLIQPIISYIVSVLLA